MTIITCDVCRLVIPNPHPGSEFGPWLTVKTNQGEYHGHDDYAGSTWLVRHVCPACRDKIVSGIRAVIENAFKEGCPCPTT